MSWCNDFILLVDFVTFINDGPYVLCCSALGPSACTELYFLFSSVFLFLRFVIGFKSAYVTF